MRDQDLAGRGIRHQARSRVHSVSDYGVVEPPWRTDIAGCGQSCIDAYPHAQPGPLTDLRVAIELDEETLNLYRRVDRVRGIVALGHGRPEDRHHGIANELIDHAAAVEDHLCHSCEVFV